MTSKLQVAAIFATAYLAIGASASIGPNTDLYIVNDAISPDGFTREAVLAGATAKSATFPGPIIKGNKGDNFQINVHDQLTDESMNKTTTIHWHGLFQHKTNYADGPAFVTQCPIAPGNSFLYDFNVPDQAGTFWYHSHLALQYCDGLRGPFIVYDPNDPHKSLYDVDDDNTVITLADWYHVPAPQIPIPAQSVSTLINGLGPNANGTGELSVITVKHGLRYRFRLVSISCDPMFNFIIDGHNMTVIEADGQNTQPLLVDSIDIYAAQRYSFVLNADQPVGNYWIRANDTTPGGPLGMAILRYEGAPDKNPTTNKTAGAHQLLEQNLHPLTDPAAPGEPVVDGVDKAMNLQFSFNGGNFFVNNHSWTSPNVPVLLQILSGAQIAQDIMPQDSVYSLPSNKSIQLSLPGGVIGGGHPLHLHGHSFSVIRSAGQPESFTNFVNPVRRDTVNIGQAGDNVTIRFVTDNPGPWFLHCHIDFHLATGFAIVLAEDIPDTHTADKPTKAWDELCPIYSALPVSDH
ncbi:laccase [Amylocystis lapponica]|nr:laccase [Amylocystis lapponica]